MKTQDEIIQELIEKGTYQDRTIDQRAYQIVFNGLKKKPNISLSSNFTLNVIERIKQHQEAKSVRNDFMWLGVGLAAFIIATFITIAITNFKFNIGAFKFLGQYGGLLVFGAAIITGLLWLEKRILPSKMAKG